MVNKERVNKFIVSKNFAYILMIIVLVIGLGMGVYALTAGVAPSPGHTLNTVSAPSGCAGNTLLKWTGTDWTCIPSPPICTGSEQGLTWTGSAWQCKTISP